MAASITKVVSFSPSDVSVARDDRGLPTYALRGAESSEESGGSEVPATAVLLDLPDGARPRSLTARVLDSAAISGAATGFGEWSQVAHLGAAGWMRGRNLASVIVLPVQIDRVSGGARLATRIELTIDLGSAPERLERRRIVAAWEEEFDRGFEAVMSRRTSASSEGLDPARRWSLQAAGIAVASVPRNEPFAPSALPSVLGSPVKYLIITNEAMRPTFQTLADSKTEEGVPAVVRTVEFITQNYPRGVDLAERLRLFIRDAYQQWGTLWVLLGGDTPVIPARYARTTYFSGNYIATDLYYSDVDGTWDADGDSLFGEGYESASNPGDGVDLFADVYVGRAPVDNAAQAQVFVNKVLAYHQNPAPGYACRGLFFGEVLDPPNWHSGDPITTDGAAILEQAIAKLTGCMTPTRMYENWTFYSGQGAVPLTRAALLDSINSGFNILNHAGHGYRNTMSVGDASLTNPDIAALHNGPRMAGLLYAIDCTSAAIDFECIGEEFLLNPNGGSASIVGSTNFDFPTTGRAYQNEFFGLVFQNSITRLGQAQALQKLPYAFFADNDNVQRWTQMSLLLLGDPELALWTAEPKTLAVTHPASTTLADTTITVTVQTGGSPVSGAQVCLLKAGEDYRVATTNASGQATLTFRPESAGSAKITVTALNCIPYRSTIAVSSAAGVALVSRAQDRRIDDSSPGTDGNGDNSLDAGETVDVLLPVYNVGGTSTGATLGTLLSLDSRATVPIPSVMYGVISPGDSANGTRYRVHVNRAGVRDGDEIHLRLALDDGLGKQWREEHYLTVRAPDLRHLSHVLDDGGLGNGDQFLDIGEEADYTVTLVNFTEGPARAVTGTLTAVSPGVVVVDGAASFGSIGPRAQATGDVFRIRNNSDASPRFRLTGSDAYGQVFTQVIDFTRPSPPSGVAGQGAASTITIQWKKSSSTDLAGYNIYRSTSPSGPFDKKTLVPTDRIAYFQDGGLAPLTRYYYEVTAVDSSANESAPTAAVSASTNPPSLPGFPITMGRFTPSSPVIGDFENDGVLEIVAGADVLYAWHSNGQGVRDADGSEFTVGDFTTQGSYYASAPAIADLDNDGQVEIVALSWDTKQLFVFRPDGSTKPGFPVTLLDAVWSSPAIGDVDGDGLKDIVFNSNGTRVYAFHHDGTELRDGDGDPGTVGVFAVVGASSNYGSPALADLDHDGKMDILCPSRDGRLYAWRWNGTNLPGFPYDAFAPLSSSPAVGDIDDDGLLEIAFVAENNRLHVVNEDGTAQPGFPVLGIPSGGVSRSPSPALADMDGDGDHEIVCAGTDGQLRIVQKDGSFYPGWTAVRFTTQTAGATESSPVVADLDGDGTLEILIGSEDGQLYGLGSDGQPFPGFPIRLSGEVRGTPLVFDLNFDRQAEIVLCGWDKNLYVWTYPAANYHTNVSREWTMFRHDGERTGRLDNRILVSAPPPAPTPERAYLLAATPNPGSGGQTIAFGVPAGLIAGVPVRLDVYDVRGRRVRELARRDGTPGRFTVNWDGRGEDGRAVAPGIYLYRLVAGREMLTGRLVRLGP